MSFKHYRIVLKLLSPLHIGKRKYSNLMETREYVPGRTLWGALTARITRDYFDGELVKYEEVGVFLHENFRFSYLWPSLDMQAPYFPWEHADFDYLFKFGYMSQAGNYERKVSDEGQLHEVEYISPKTRNSVDVYLVGDLWVRESIASCRESLKITISDKEIDLIKIFDFLQLGGEKGYGWGRVKLKALNSMNGKKALGDIAFEINENDVVLKFTRGQHLTAHALASDWEFKENQRCTKIGGKYIEGQIEPLTGYALGQDNSWEIPNPPICFSPGSKVKEDLKTKIVHFGILAFT